MTKTMFDEKEEVLSGSVLKETIGAVQKRLEYLEFLDTYDKEKIPIELEESLKEEIQEIKELEENWRPILKLLSTQ